MDKDKARDRQKNGANGDSRFEFSRGEYQVVDAETLSEWTSRGWHLVRIVQKARVVRDEKVVSEFVPAPAEQLNRYDTRYGSPPGQWQEKRIPFQDLVMEDHYLLLRDETALKSERNDLRIAKEHLLEEITTLHAEVQRAQDAREQAEKTLEGHTRAIETLAAAAREAESKSGQEIRGRDLLLQERDKQLMVLKTALGTLRYAEILKGVS
jgi:hypothetical protein